MNKLNITTAKKQNDPTTTAITLHPLSLSLIHMYRLYNKVQGEKKRKEYLIVKYWTICTMHQGE